jgi:hypothetical protein
MSLTPFQGPITAREDTATVAHSQGGALGGVDDPAGPADVQGQAGGTAQDRREQGRGCLESGRQPPVPVVASKGIVVAGAAGVVVVGGGWRVIRTRVTAPSQASRRHASGSNGPAQPTSPPRVPGPLRPWRLSRSTTTVSWGRTPPVLGQPAALQAAAGQFSEGVGLALATTAAVFGIGRASQRLQRRHQDLAGF